MSAPARLLPPGAALRARRRAAVAVPLIALLAGCAGTAPEAAPDATPGDRPAAGAAAWAEAPRPAALDEVRVIAEVYRTRIDPSRGGIQLTVRNEGDAPLALAAARLTSPLLAAEPARDDRALIPAGGARDLPLTLPAPVCPADAAEATQPEPPEAVLAVPLADGSTAELRVPTTDRLGQWADWFADACFAEAVADAAQLRVRVPSGTSAAGGTVEVELVASPRRAAGGAGAGGDELRLVSVAGTVLLGPLDADGRAATSIPLDRLVEPQSEQVVTLRFTPNRCDAHAIADDKQGTLFRVEVALGDRAGIVTVAADAPTKDAIYAAITAACAADG